MKYMLMPLVDAVLVATCDDDDEDCSEKQQQQQQHLDELISLLSHPLPSPPLPPPNYLTIASLR